MTEQELFINLDNTQVLRGSLADVIWQGCKALQSEIEETENGTRKDYLVSCLYKGLVYHYLVLGCSEDEAKEQAKGFILED